MIEEQIELIKQKKRDIIQKRYKTIEELMKVVHSSRHIGYRINSKYRLNIGFLSYIKKKEGKEIYYGKKNKKMMISFDGEYTLSALYWFGSRALDLDSEEWASIEYLSPKQWKKLKDALRLVNKHANSYILKMLKEELNEIEGDEIDECGYCNKVIHDPDAVYCSECGNKILSGKKELID